MIKDRRTRARAIAAVVLVAFVALSCRSDSDEDTRPAVGTSQPPAPVEPALEQADWKINVFPVAVSGKLGKKQQKRMDKQRKKLKRAVRAVFNSMLLEPDSARRNAKIFFAPKARAAFLKSDAGLPEGATTIQTKRRKAAVGVEARAMKRAAADVMIRYDVEVDERNVTLRLDSKLWFERTSSGWKVIAFEVGRKKAR